MGLLAMQKSISGRQKCQCPETSGHWHQARVLKYPGIINLQAFRG
jgi:hypothetical protein